MVKMEFNRFEDMFMYCNGVIFVIIDIVMLQRLVFFMFCNVWNIIFLEVNVGQFMFMRGVLIL